MTSHILYSMTGFARTQGQGSWGMLTCELRSINHRYLEMGLHLPEALRGLENIIREQVRLYIKRGKVECYIRYQTGESKGSQMNININLAKQLCQVSDEIGKLLKNAAPVNAMDVLRWPGILQMEELDLEVIENEMIKLIEKALHDLIEMRAREGEELRKIFLQRLDAMQQELAKAKNRIPEIMVAQREKLMARFKDAKLELDPNRLEQEMILFTQRIDVTEEIERLTAHMIETRRTLKQGGMVGRRLDFLMQELHREANTLGAKSAHLDTTRASVELKVLIEQMREQVQNVE